MIPERKKLFQETAASLRREILGGEYRDGLPAERVLARQFGVSYMTMRRAIGELTQAGLVTREHGRGTFVNTPGRKLQRTYGIGMVVPERVICETGTLSPFFSEVFTGALSAAALHGYHILLDSSLERLIRIERGSRKVDAIITVCPDHPEELLQVSQFIPVIVAGNDEPCGNFPTLSYDNFAAAREAVNYLIACGHRRVAVLSPSLQIPAFYHRLCGARKALEDHGLEYRCEIDVTTRPLDDLAALLADPDSAPTACFCTNDMLACRLLSDLYVRGYRVPDQLSVVGFDGLPFAALSSPPLTTVTLPKTELGARAVNKALAYLEGPLTPEQFREQLPLSLTIRQSVKEIKA